MTQFAEKRMAQVVRRARALGDPTRLRILLLLARSERAVGQVASALAIQQSTVSKHLQVLFNAGLVDRRRAANAVIYSADAAHIERLLAAMAAEQPRRRRIDSSRGPHAIPSSARRHV
jgi:DNA-binding transcriptional ArsR family regulator